MGRFSADRDGMPVGRRLTDHVAAALPSGRRLAGASVSIVPFDAERHVEALRDALPPTGPTWTYMAYGPFASGDALADWARSFLAGGDPPFDVWVVAGRPAGFSTWQRAAPEHGSIELAHVVLSPALRRTRAATEGFYLLLGHAFDDLGYRRVEWKCDALNAASRAAAERLGFVHEGTFRDHLVVKGRNRDTAWYALLRDGWRRRRADLEAWLDADNFDADGRQRRPLARAVTEG